MSKADDLSYQDIEIFATAAMIGNGDVEILLAFDGDNGRNSDSALL